MAIAALVALIVVAGTRNDDRERDTFETRDVGPAPERVLVLTADGDLEIHRTSDGRLVDEVGEVASTKPPISIATDGRSAYVDQPAPRRECRDARAIERIDLSSGKTKSVGSGRAPAVSPDGEQIAYATSRDGCGRDTLVIQDIADGYERRYRARSGEGVTYLHWSRDGTKIGFTLLEKEGFSNRVLDTTSKNRRLERASELSLPYEEQPLGFLSGDRVLGMSSPDGGRVRLYAMNDDREEFPLIERDAFIDIGTISIDASGDHLLWLERTENDRTGSTPGTIVRFNTGTRETEVIADDAIAATWLPPPSDAV